MMSIQVLPQDSASVSRAAQLADKLRGYELTADMGMQLLVSVDGLALKMVGKNYKPLTVDLLSGQVDGRRRRAGFRNESIAKAVGVRSGNLPRVMDATAGLGTDSFILANLGCQVLMFERSPLIALLLEDGLSRAATDPGTKAIIRRMRLMREDSLTWLLENKTSEFDVIYLDPMFPPRKGTALSGREMQYLQVLSASRDSSSLIEGALESDVGRIVLKRPRHALRLSRKPSFTLTGRSCRFDVFVK